MKFSLVALGSNLGDRSGTLSLALVELDSRGFAVLARSSFYETKPVGYLNQPDFLNAAALVGVPDTVPAETFLETLLAIEKKFGRVRTFPNAPRTLDLDLIFFENETRSTPTLTLPHPRWRERDFVKIPLAEIFEKLDAAGTPVPACFSQVRKVLEPLRAPFPPHVKKQARAENEGEKSESRRQSNPDADALHPARERQH